MTFDISIIDTIESLEQFVPEWKMFLQTQPLGMSVYNHPDYLLAHARHCPDGSCNQQLAIVVVREQGKIVCIAPLSIRDQQFRLELSTKRLFSIRIRQMICSDNSFIFVNNPQNAFAYFDAVFGELQRAGIKFDLLNIFGLRNNSPFWDYCTTHLTGKPFRLFNVLAEPQHDMRIHLPNSIETLLASIGKKQRYNIRSTIKHFHQSVIGQNPKDVEKEEISHVILAKHKFNLPVGALH
jgi:hypothetical protein